MKYITFAKKRQEDNLLLMLQNYLLMKVRFDLIFNKRNSWNNHKQLIQYKIFNYIEILDKAKHTRSKDELKNFYFAFINSYLNNEHIA